MKKGLPSPNLKEACNHSDQNSSTKIIITNCAGEHVAAGT